VWVGEDNPVVPGTLRCKKPTFSPPRIETRKASKAVARRKVRPSFLFWGFA
jgi:hypothetical protein